MTPSTIIIPVLNAPELSRRAIASAASQLGVDPLRVLVIDQGSAAPTVEMLDQMHQLLGDVLRIWRHAPPLLSLSATWNLALDYAWQSGCKDALVINNDVELPLTYYSQLRVRMQQDAIHFLSGVGVNPGQAVGLPPGRELTEPFQLHPDFSAFVITRKLHRDWPMRFDEQFVPAYLEDCDFHRRMFLADLGWKIGKINIPFLHYASGTLKGMNPDENRRVSQAIEQGSRAYYRQKWGAGGLNGETKVAPFGPDVEYPVTMDTLRSIAERGLIVSLHLVRDAADRANAIFERELYAKTRPVDESPSRPEPL